MIDSHQHFWVYTDEEFGWVTDDMAVLRSDFLPDQLTKETGQGSGVEGVISIQARCSHEENDFLLKHAEQSDLVLGVAGWVDLKSPDADENLARYAKNPNFKGVREICQGATDEEFLANSDFDRGVRALKNHHLAYDILIFQNQLDAATQFASRHPEQRMVIDHAAKPEITQAGMPDDWKKGIKAIAELPHISCKFSGLTTEIRDDSSPTPTLFQPYFDILLETFGPDRLMFGSDWPVSLLGTSYQEWSSSFLQLISELSDDEQEKINSLNARRFYRI